MLFRLFRRAYPQRCFSIRRAGVWPSPPTHH